MNEEDVLNEKKNAHDEKNKKSGNGNGGKSLSSSFIVAFLPNDHTDYTGAVVVGKADANAEGNVVVVVVVVVAVAVA